VRVAIEELAGALGPQDTLGIVGFADRAEVLRGRSPISEPFTLQPGYFDGGRPGGTNLFAGLDTALDVTVGSDLGSHYVLIVSDGDANVGPVDFGSFQALIDRAELAGVQLAQFDLGGEMRSSHLETYLRHTGRYYELEAQASLGGAIREALHPMQPTERSPRRAGLLRKTLGESQQFSAEVTQMQLEVAHGTFAR
jgi:hypothetical protein